MSQEGIMEDLLDGAIEYLESHPVETLDPDSDDLLFVDMLGEGRVMTIQQRIKAANRMRRLAPRFSKMRAIKAKRMAPPDRLSYRARKAALMGLRKRVAGKMGMNYRSLTKQQKINIDNMVMKRFGKGLPAILKKLSVRLMPIIRKKEMIRLAKARGQKVTHGSPKVQMRTPIAEASKRKKSDLEKFAVQKFKIDTADENDPIYDDDDDDEECQDNDVYKKYDGKEEDDRDLTSHGRNRKLFIKRMHEGFINHRELAAQGKMHTSMVDAVKKAKDGFDYYEHGTGDKKPAGKFVQTYTHPVTKKPMVLIRDTHRKEHEYEIVEARKSAANAGETTTRHITDHLERNIRDPDYKIPWTNHAPSSIDSEHARAAVSLYASMIKRGPQFKPHERVIITRMMQHSPEMFHKTMEDLSKRMKLNEAASEPIKVVSLKTKTPKGKPPYGKYDLVGPDRTSSSAGGAPSIGAALFPDPYARRIIESRSIPGPHPDSRHVREVEAHGFRKTGEEIVRGETGPRRYVTRYHHYEHPKHSGLKVSIAHNANAAGPSVIRVERPGEHHGVTMNYPKTFRTEMRKIGIERDSILNEMFPAQQRSNITRSLGHSPEGFHKAMRLLGGGSINERKKDPYVKVVSLKGCAPKKPPYGKYDVVGPDKSSQAFGGGTPSIGAALFPDSFAPRIVENAQLRPETHWDHVQKHLADRGFTIHKHGPEGPRRYHPATRDLEQIWIHPDGRKVTVKRSTNASGRGEIEVGLHTGYSERKVTAKTVEGLNHLIKEGVGLMTPAQIRSGIPKARTPLAPFRVNRPISSNQSGPKPVVGPPQNTISRTAKGMIREFAERYDIPEEILQEVYSRGGGDFDPHSAMKRVKSFIYKGRSWHDYDGDLAEDRVVKVVGKSGTYYRKIRRKPSARPRLSLPSPTSRFF